MIHCLQFEEQEQPDWGSGQQLAQELANRNRPPLPTVTQLTRIFTAFMGALFLALCFLVLLPNDPVASVVAAHPPLLLAQVVFFAGVLFALAVVLFTGVPLAVVAWRSTPSVRFLLVIPFVAFVLPLLLFFLGFSGPVGLLLAGVLLVVPLWRSRQRMRFLLVIPFVAFVLLSLLRVMHLGIHPGVLVFISVDIFFLASALMAAAVWRAIPRMRILSTLLFLIFGLGFLSSILAVLLPNLLPDEVMGTLGNMVNTILNYPLPLIGNLAIVIVLLIVCGFPVLTTLAINHAMQQAALPEKWLCFARLPSRLVAFALLVMFLGLLSWGAYLAVFAPGVLFSLNFPPLPFNPWLIMVVGMLICVVMAARAFSEKK